MDDDVGTSGRLEDVRPGEQIRLDDLDSGGKRPRPLRPSHDGSNLMPREARATDHGGADRSFRPEDDDLHENPRFTPADKRDGNSSSFWAYVHDACTLPPYPSDAPVGRLVPTR